MTVTINVNVSGMSRTDHPNTQDGQCTLSRNSGGLLRMHIHSDCGVCSWPWHWSAFGKAEWPLLVTRYRCMSVKNTLGWSAVAFCPRKIIQLFSVMFCVVRALLKFDIRLVTNDTPNKWRPMERPSVIETHVFDRIYVFPRPSSRVLGHLPKLCRSNAFPRVGDITCSTIPTAQYHFTRRQCFHGDLCRRMQ